MQHFAFRAGDQVYAIDVQEVYRVLDDLKVTPVPLTPRCHFGLLYHRGELFDVIDGVHLLGKGGTVLRRNSRGILVKRADKKLALVPDEVIGLVWEGEPAGRDSAGIGRANAIQPISIAQLWQMLTERFHGFDQVSKNLYPGI
jgi:chemotaxis signal transduction protein